MCLPAHDGEEWTIGVLESLGKVRQLLLEQETRRLLGQLTADHRTGNQATQDIRFLSPSYIGQFRN